MREGNSAKTTLFIPHFKAKMINFNNKTFNFIYCWHFVMQ